MAKKKTTKSGTAANVKKIYHNDSYVIATAMRLYQSGQRTSPISIYHEIKGKLKLPSMYDFASGDAIKEIMKEEGWIWDMNEEGWASER